MYINAAKGYFAVAKKIDDKATRASLLYLSVLAAHKAEFFSSSHVPNKNNVDDDSKESTKLISSTAGRMNTFQSPETLYEGSTRRDIERGSRPSGHEVVADLLVLEARLADLGKQFDMIIIIIYYLDS